MPVYTGTYCPFTFYAPPSFSNVLLHVFSLLDVLLLEPEIVSVRSAVAQECMCWVALSNTHEKMRKKLPLSHGLAKWGHDMVGRRGVKKEKKILLLSPEERRWVAMSDSFFS